MAYRERLTPKDIVEAGKLLRAVRTGHHGVATKDGFEVLHSCGQMLADVGREFREDFPRLATWRRWGPGYFDLDDDAHVVSWQLWHREKRRQVGVGFWFHPTKAPTLGIYHGTTGVWGHWDIKHFPLRRVLGDGVLDPGKIREAFRDTARQWKTL